MSPLDYALIIVLCIPIFIALDQGRLKLAFLFWFFLMLFLMLTAFLPTLELPSELKWLVWLVEFYFIRRQSKLK